ncbi:MAG: family hydrolase [Proteobacteria bacterium]|nr:family hydrolase [Pseudomonadota bacterium]MBS1246227.1 family hydrolase [Pseudomonadota bacterium]
MNRQFDLIIFDWDGTLMDSEAKIVRCMQAAAVDVGIPDPGTAAIRDIIGLGLNEAMQVLFPEQAPVRRAELVERYRRHFLELDATDMPLFPGVPQGLTQLTQQGYLLAIATGKARRGLNRVLDDTGMSHLFVSSRCADEAFSKPHPKMLEDILDDTGVDAGRALMVGDTVYDMEMARNAKVAGLAVSYGVHARERLLDCGALACLNSFPEVCAWVK